MLSATGELVLDANHVGAWGGSQSGGQIAGMLIAPFISDRFGRRLSMLILSTILVIVSFSVRAS
jgi:MFS family permease